MNESSKNKNPNGYNWQLDVSGQKNASVAIGGAIGTSRPTSEGWQADAAGRAMVTTKRGFSLIELLVVISIIAVLAAFTIVGMQGVTKTREINSAKAELKEIEAAIESYHSKYGVYPPGNPTNTATAALYTPLYYELTGVSFQAGGTTVYQTVDTNIQVSAINNIFGAAGILNCTKGSGEELAAAQNFLPGLPAKMVRTVIENGQAVEMLATTVDGPDAAYQPVGWSGANVFRYMSPSPTNHNANSYDLWINLSIGGTNFGGGNNTNKLYLIANWQNGATGGSTMP